MLPSEKGMDFFFSSKILEPPACQPWNSTESLVTHIKAKVITDQVSMKMMLEIFKKCAQKNSSQEP